MAVYVCLSVHLSPNAFLSGTGMIAYDRSAAGPVVLVPNILMVVGAYRISHSDCTSLF